MPSSLNTTSLATILGSSSHGNGQKISSMPVTMAMDSTESSKEYQDQVESHMLAYVLVPLGSLVLIIVLSFLVVFILKKSKLDRLRHHLMPLYNFEPGDEDGDWESELLEEDKEQQMALHIESPGSPRHSPQLKFHSEHSEL